MKNNDLDKLAALIEHENDNMLARWREQIRQLSSAKNLDIPTLNDHIPLLLKELVVALRSRSDETIPEAILDGSPHSHGIQRVADGFDIEEVVAEYNILRGCIHDLADANGLSLQGKPFHILNRVLDGAIGLAVQTYATRRALDIQHRREEYLAFVAHDLRTPLSAISLATGILELKLANVDASTDAPRLLKTLHRNVQHIGGLVEKILKENINLHREVGIKLERREFDLWPLVEALIHDLHPIAGTASTRLVNAVPDDFVVYADASLLKRVFQNLIANAITHTPRGEIVIGAKIIGPDQDVECWVEDNGTGIPADRLSNVFELFETDHQNEGALGLGLAIVKTFVEAHDGQVAIESVEGSGSTFRFTLPTKRT